MRLPTFIVIGVAKAGTTSLYRYLDQHPQVYMYPGKATNFFGYEDARDWRWHDEGEPPMLRNFPVRTWEAYEAAFAGATREPAVGEVSPQYLRCPTAASRIREALPDVRLIASLRNPVERAFSGYLMRWRRGEPVRTVREDLTPESSHVRESLYARRLQRFYDLVPRERIKVYLFDDFRSDPGKIVDEVFSFIGVDPAFRPDTSARHNPASVPRSRLVNRVFYHPATIRAAKAVFPERAYGLAKRVRQLNQEPPPRLPPDVRNKLLDFYREDIARLEVLLERDLSLWLEGTQDASSSAANREPWSARLTSS